MLRPLYVHARGHLTGRRRGDEYAQPRAASPDYHHNHLPFHDQRRQRRRAPTTAGRRQQRHRIRGPWSLEFTWPTLGTLQTTIADKFTSLSSGSPTMWLASNQRSRLDAAARDQDERAADDGTGPEGAASARGDNSTGAVPLQHVDSAGGFSDDIEIETPPPSGGVTIETVYFGRTK